MKIIYVFVFTLLLLSSSCEKNNMGNSAGLTGKWKLDSVRNKQSNTFDYYPGNLNKDITIEFESTGIVYLRGTCNTGSANYVISDHGITFTNVALTEIACEFPGADWENYLFELVNVTDYDIYRNSLRLITDTDIDLCFSKM